MKNYMILILFITNLAFAHSSHNTDAAVKNAVQIDKVNLSEDKNMTSMSAAIDLIVGSTEKDHLMSKLQRLSQHKNITISIEDLGGYPQSKLHVVLKGKTEKVKKVLFKLEAMARSSQ